MSASQFADEIGVPRSSISHLLSGRNKPSLEFVLKVNESFPTLTVDWLVLGKEDHLSNSNESQGDAEVVSTPLAPQKELKASQEIEKIVVFYKNGLFKEYAPDAKH